MSTPPAGIPEADWLATPTAVRAFVLAQQQEIEQLRSQLTALATELAQLRERIGRSSRNSSKPPSSDGPGFKPPQRRKGSGRKSGAQAGHPQGLLKVCPARPPGSPWLGSAGAAPLLILANVAPPEPCCSH